MSDGTSEWGERVAGALERLANVAELHALRSVPLTPGVQAAIRVRQERIVGPTEPQGLAPDYADSAE